MKITSPKIQELETNFGDVVHGKSKAHYMIVKDEEGFTRLLHLSTFTLYSVKYDNPSHAVRSYFDECVRFPVATNELVVGGIQ